MARKPTKATPDDKAQSAAFIEKARELEADKESVAETVMERLAKTPPKPRTPKEKS